MTLGNQDHILTSFRSQYIPNRCYPLIFVGAVIAVGRMSNLMSGILLVLFSGWAHSFISCQLLVKGFGFSLSLGKGWLGSTSHSDITSAV